jgi:hypothetical protein
MVTTSGSANDLRSELDSMTIAAIVWAVLILTWVLRANLGAPSSFTLLQHQRGLLYRRGKPVREVCAGQHRVWVGVEKILFIDIRPITVSFENRAVTLTDGATAMYGFSGTAEVDDAKKALYCAGNYNDMPAFVLLCCARLVLNSQNSIGLLAKHAAIVEEIMNRAKPRLSAAGFRLLTFRMTQLGLAAQARAEK